MLAQHIRDELLEIVKAENFFDDPEVLEKFSKDFSLVPPGMPNYVMKPKDTREVQKIIKIANEHSIPLVPSSSWVYFYGAAIPR